MPMLPSPERMEKIRACCMELMEQGETLGAMDIANRLMRLPELPMHCPYHHFLVPAALLTAARMTDGNHEALEKDLAAAMERSGQIPGGTCGLYGCCGAAIGAGIFASIYQKTTPTSKHGWAADNAMTARCLQNVAAVEGPRCCKRVTWLTLQAAIPAAKELLGVDLGEASNISCEYYTKNRECRGKDCPFFPAEDEDI